MGPTELNVIPLKFVAAATITCPIFHHPLTVFHLHTHTHTHLAAWLRTLPNLPEILYTEQEEEERERDRQRERKKRNRIKNRHQQLKTPPYPRLTFAFLWQQTVLDGPRLPERSMPRATSQHRLGREESIPSFLSLSYSCSGVLGFFSFSQLVSYICPSHSRFFPHQVMLWTHKLRHTSQINFSDVTVRVSTVCLYGYSSTLQQFNRRQCSVRLHGDTIPTPEV